VDVLRHVARSIECNDISCYVVRLSDCVALVVSQTGCVDVYGML
jgi:hypothetical protein